MSLDRFFEETEEQSRVKAEIVEKYFHAWARIISSTQTKLAALRQRIAYIDLFAGPGRYANGEASTPLRILGTAIESPSYAQRLVTIFNDVDKAHAKHLEAEIAKLPGIERLQYQPQVCNEEVGAEVARLFTSRPNIPTLAFIDPWGYKGLSLDLVNAFLKDWGCDCIFFFNYNRINMGLSNPVVREHMVALFGSAAAEPLRLQLQGLSAARRETMIVEALAAALKTRGRRYVLPFCFKNASGRRTTHHLILVTKHFRGYEVMKEIMAKSSSEENQGVPSFTYLRPSEAHQGLLFELSRPLEQLRGMLLEEFAGRTVTTEELYKCHSVDRPFLERNYKKVLRELFEAGRIQAEPKPRSGTFGNRIRVTFPPRRA